jgi:hypothetical protein
MSPAPARRRLIFTVFTRYSGAREYTNPLNPKPVASMLLQGLLSAYSYYMLYQNGAVGRPGSRLQLLHEFHHLLLPIPVDAWWAGVGSICMSRRRFAWVSLPARPRQTGQDRVPATVAVPVPPPTRPQGVQLGAFLFGSTGNKCSGYGTPVRRCPRSDFCLTRSQPAQAGFSDRRISLGPLTAY